MPNGIGHQSTYGDNRRHVKNDGFLQGDYDFSDIGVKNHWGNLFKDNTVKIQNVGLMPMAV